MKLSDFDYNLPKELIANTHAEPRDHSRLLVLDRESGLISHRHFYDIVNYLQKGDILVFNNSKVFKARIFGKKETGGKIEFLVIRNIEKNIWEVMAKGKLRVGDKILFSDKVMAEVLEKDERTLRVKFNISVEKMFNYLEKHGEMPLPPYIKESPNAQIPMTNQTLNSKSQNNNLKLKSYKLQAKKLEFYQTVYADKIGSVAAPTAGFHFTDELMDKLKKKGVEFLDVTLHVGPGTFLPVEVDDFEKHKMHEEFFEVQKETWNKILKEKKEGKRIIAVGTTTSRVLEYLGKVHPAEAEQNIIGSTDIFIYPPYKFKVIDGLITNFHLPKSTLLMLVSAFADPGGTKGVSLMKKAYLEAVQKKYRFYSFGDSMFIK